jgi:hypothetical protein
MARRKAAIADANSSPSFPVLAQVVDLMPQERHFC